ncbi:TauD/TfdA-like domain [Fusarium oxysporum f. sp. vasinfectum]|nr:TauD/TfdA-like domain [Fusarium oxysporum f. sp. vasinfectum]
MAPSAVETQAPTADAQKVKLYPGHVEGVYKELSPVAYRREAEEKGIDGHAAAKTKSTLPLEPFEHYEHGKDADPTFPNLLKSTTKISHLTPTIGTEIEGVQLSSLSDAGKDELARYVAERKVFGGYFGRHHIHPTSGSPEGHPEIHLVHRSAGDKSYEEFFKTRVSSVAWHSDITYEQQPPGTTFLYVLDNPDTGGDTLFANTVEAYNRLSPTFQKLLHGLKATHSGIEQVNASVKKGSIKRREPVVNEHPIVRTHPVTGEKSLFVNPQFTRSIVGLKKEESDAILNFLYEHIAWGADFHARVRWQEKTVVVWDNRSVQHTAILDWHSGQRRHLARITPQAERPYETPFEG